MGGSNHSRLRGLALAGAYFVSLLPGGPPYLLWCWNGAMATFKTAINRGGGAIVFAGSCHGLILQIKPWWMHLVRLAKGSIVGPANGAYCSA